MIGSNCATVRLYRFFHYGGRRRSPNTHLRSQLVNRSVQHCHNRPQPFAVRVYTVYEPGVFLLGGLCVDPACYRLLSADERGMVAAEGSLARWLMRQSIERLRPTRAVFGYTGDTRSRRDTRALGFIQAAEP